MQQYTLRIAAVRNETEDAVTICFKQPALRKLKYLAGQYLTVIVRINGRRYMRPYSFSSAPGVDAFLEITVKRVPGGMVSNHICDQLKEGDSLEVIEPMGDFIFPAADVDGQVPVMFWGAGSGITPLISLIKSILANQEGNIVTLVYGNKNKESVIFARQIRELQRQYPDTFSTWHFHTHAVVDSHYPEVIQGRISPKKVLDVLTASVQPENALHFICGPLGLKESVKAELLLRGIDPRRIYSEDFELVKDPKEFEDISTRIITLLSGNQQHVVEVVKGKSVLEAGLDSMVELSYSCQTGHCLICKGILISGKLKMIGVERNPDLKGDEHLLCCSYPLSNDIEISIN